MKDEIKEILDYLHNNTFIPDETKRKYKILHRDEVKLLLDYITNLELIEQQYSAILSENVELENKITDLQEELEEEKRIEQEDFKAIQNLEEENKRLKETNVYCNRTDCSGRIKDSRKYDSVYQEKEDYKSRNEKAIEYIKETINENYEWDEYKENKLLNILQGEDNETR